MTIYLSWCFFVFNTKEVKKGRNIQMMKRFILAGTTLTLLSACSGEPSTTPIVTHTEEKVEQAKKKEEVKTESKAIETVKAMYKAASKGDKQAFFAVVNIPRIMEMPEEGFLGVQSDIKSKGLNALQLEELKKESITPEALSIFTQKYGEYGSEWVVVSEKVDGGFSLWFLHKKDKTYLIMDQSTLLLENLDGSKPNATASELLSDTLVRVHENEKINQRASVKDGVTMEDIIYKSPINTVMMMYEAALKRDENTFLRIAGNYPGMDTNKGEAMRDLADEAIKAGGSDADSLRLQHITKDMFKPEVIDGLNKKYGKNWEVVYRWNSNYTGAYVWVLQEIDGQYYVVNGDDTGAKDALK
jgi:hypothetical protein